MPAGCHMPLVSNTIKGDNVIAFKTHNHFSISGNAPGEVHGGASPEEILVPIIRFKKLGEKQKKADAATSYSLASSDVYLDSNGDVTLYINTQGLVKNVTVEINGNQLQANEAGSEKWKVLISGLILDKIYSVRIYLNDIYSTVAETIHVKRKGLIIDDDI